MIKKTMLVLLGLFSLILVAGGCVVRGPAPVVAVRPARVRVHAPRVRVEVAPRHCHATRCRRVCNIWGCWDRCREGAYPCY